MIFPSVTIIEQLQRSWSGDIPRDSVDIAEPCRVIKAGEYNGVLKPAGITIVNVNNDYLTSASQSIVKIETHETNSRSKLRFEANHR